MMEASGQCGYASNSILLAFFLVLLICFVDVIMLIVCWVRAVFTIVVIGDLALLIF